MYLFYINSTNLLLLSLPGLLRWRRSTSSTTFHPVGARSFSKTFWTTVPLILQGGKPLRWKRSSRRTHAASSSDFYPLYIRSTLVEHPRSASTQSTFKSGLKTFLLATAFYGNVGPTWCNFLPYTFILTFSSK